MLQLSSVQIDFYKLRTNLFEELTLTLNKDFFPLAPTTTKSPFFDWHVFSFAARIPIKSTAVDEICTIVLQSRPSD